MTYGYNHDMWSTARLMFAFQAHLRCLHFSSWPLTTVKDQTLFIIITLNTIIINTALFSIIIISNIIIITNGLILSKRSTFYKLMRLKSEEIYTPPFLIRAIFFFPIESSTRILSVTIYVKIYVGPLLLT